MPLLDLVFRAASVHRRHHDPALVQKCTLLSIKTGGCPEDCNYCSQSSSHETGTRATKLMGMDEVYEAAVRAKASGSTRFCMGAAWRGPSQARQQLRRRSRRLPACPPARLAVAPLRRGSVIAVVRASPIPRRPYCGAPISTRVLAQVGKGQWARVLEMVRKVRALDMEVCTTLGMLTPEQAAELREAGLTAYNHNLDTSREYYSQVTSTRKYDDRLDTIDTVRAAGISVCAGGIIGLGEGAKDRVGLLLQLATMPAHPESVPINRLVAISGTPFEDNATPDGFDLVRCIAVARVLMPRTVVRLSAGRTDLTPSDQVRATGVRPIGSAAQRCVPTCTHADFPGLCTRHSRSHCALQALAFLAGANSIFSGDKLLTTPNPEESDDSRLLASLGLQGRPAFVPYEAGEASSRFA